MSTRETCRRQERQRRSPSAEKCAIVMSGGTSVRPAMPDRQAAAFGSKRRQRLQAQLLEFDLRVEAFGQRGDEALTRRLFRQRRAAINTVDDDGHREDDEYRCR